MAGFRLTKRYLDVVGGEGDAAVCHVGRVSWKGLSVRHAALVVRDVDGSASESRVFRGPSGS